MDPKIQKQADEINSLPDLSDEILALPDVDQKKNSDSNPLWSALKWVGTAASALDSGIRSGVTNLSNTILDQVKQQKGFDTNEQAANYINTRAQVTKAVDKYAPDLEALNVPDPHKFLDQPVDNIAKWYFDKKQQLQSDIAQHTPIQHTPGNEGMPSNYQDAVIQQKQAQLQKLDDMKKDLFALKIGEDKDPKEAGFEYLRLFEPGKMQAIEDRMGMKGMTATNSSKISQVLASVPADEISKALPPSMVYDIESNGYDIKARQKVEKMKATVDDVNDRRRAYQKQYDGLVSKLGGASPTDKPVITDQISKLQSSFQNDPVVSEFDKDHSELTSLFNDKINLVHKYPEVEGRAALQDYVEKKFNDQDVVSRQLMGSPSIGEPIGSYGFIGGFVKAMTGMGKDVAKTLNAAGAALGLKNESDAFFQNYKMDEGLDDMMVTPESARLQKFAGVELPADVATTAKALNIDPSALNFMGKQKSAFNWNGVMTTMGDMTGQVVGQFALGEGAGKLMKGVSGALNPNVDLLNTGDLFELKTGLSLENKSVSPLAQSRAGVFASTLATTYGTNYTEGIKAGLSPDKAESYALISSLGTAATYMVAPYSKSQREMIGMVEPSTIKELSGILADKALTRKDQILQFVKRYGSVATHMGKEIGEGTAEAVTNVLQSHVLDSAYNLDDTQNMSLMDDAGQTAMHTAIGMIPMAVFGGYGYSNRLRTEALYQSGMNQEGFRSYWDDKIAKETDPKQKEYLQSQANHAMQIANTMAGIVRSLPETNAQGRTLTEDERMALSEKLFKSKKLQNDANNAVHETVAAPVADQARAAQDEARDIINGTAPTYIINDRSYSKEKFLEFVNSDDYEKLKDDVQLQVHNDPETTKALEEKGVTTQQNIAPDAPAAIAPETIAANEEQTKRLDNEKSPVETGLASSNLNNMNTAPDGVQGSVPTNIKENSQPLVTRLDNGPVKTEFTPQEQVESDKVGDNVKQKFDDAPKAVSNVSITKTLPNGSRISGRYALVPENSITPSHDPVSFGNSEGFPMLENGENPNDRNYSLPENKASVVATALHYNDNAVDQPPTVTPNGVVIDGNQRTMAGQLAASQKTDGQYNEALKGRLPVLGFSQEDYDHVAKSGNPRLVFLSDNVPEYSTPTFSAFNQDAKKEKSPSARAIELGRVVPKDVVSRISRLFEGSDTMSDFYKNRKNLDTMFDTLEKNGILLKNQIPRYYNESTKTIEPDGKNFVELLLLGNVVGEKELGLLSKDGIKSYRQKIVRAISTLSEIEGLNPDFSIKETLNSAISLKDALNNTDLTLDEFIAQGNLFENSVPSPETILMHYNLEMNDKSFRDFLNRYAERASMSSAGNQDLFSIQPDTKESILFDLSNKLSDEQKQTISTARTADNQQSISSTEQSTANNAPVIQDATGQAGSGGTEQQSGSSDNGATGTATATSADATGDTATGGDRAALIQKAVDSADDIQGFTKDAFLQKPEVGLKNIAEQLNLGGNAADNTRKFFGDTISDIALKLFPDAKTDLTGTSFDNNKNSTNATQNSEQLQNEGLQKQGDQSEHSAVEEGQRNQGAEGQASAETDSSNSDIGGDSKTEENSPEKIARIEVVRTDQEREQASNDLDNYLKTVSEDDGEGVNASVDRKTSLANVQETYTQSGQEDQKSEYRQKLEKELEDLRAKYSDATAAARLEEKKDAGAKTLGGWVRNLLSPNTSESTKEAQAKAYEAKKLYRRAKEELRAGVGVERGPNWLVEKFSRAARNEEISQKSADLAIDLIRTNPNLFTDLAISITRPPDKEGNLALNGFYQAGQRLIKIFHGSPDETGIHELLHHTERFLPLDVRDKIIDEWYNHTQAKIDEFKQQLEGETDPVKRDQLTTNLLYLGLAQQRQAEPSVRNQRDMEAVMYKLLEKLPANAYSLFNPSEYWAENASRIYADNQSKPEAKGFVQKVKSFYDGIVKSVKDALGLNPFKAVEKGLKAVLSGDTLDTQQGRQLSNTNTLFSLSPAYIKQRREQAENAMVKMMPLGVVKYEDYLNELMARDHTELLPFAADAYRNIRDDEGRFPLNPVLRAGMTGDAAIDVLSAKNIAASDAAIQVMGNMYLNNISQGHQTVADASEEVGLLPISRDKRTKVLDYINEAIAGANGVPFAMGKYTPESFVSKQAAKLRDFMTKRFTVGGGIDPVVRMLKENEMGRMNEWVVKVKHIQQDFNDQVAKDYGKNYTHDQRIVVDKALKGDLPSIATLSPELQNVVMKMRGVVDGITNQMIQQGIVPETTVAREQLDNAIQSEAPPETINALRFKLELAKTVENRIGTYINRQYEKHYNKDWKNKVLQDKDKVQSAANYLYNLALINQGKELAPEDVQKMIESIVDTGDIGVVMNSTSMGMDMSVLKHMQDIPPQIRDLMGEIKDPEWNFVNTTIKMATLLERHKFLQDTYNDTKGRLFNDTADLDKGLTEQINNKMWGELHGKYTSPELLEALKDWNKEKVDRTLMMNTLRTVTSYTKAAKTSLSWVSEMKNLLGNGVMLLQNGNFSPTDLHTGLLAIKDIFGKVDDPGQRAFIEKMARLNIVGNNLPVNEIVGATKDMVHIVPDSTDWNPGALAKFSQKLSAIKDKAGEVYGATDDIFKICTFLNERSRLEKAYGASNVPKTEEELDNEAGQIVLQTMPTFFKVPSIVQAASHNLPLFGNFVSYPIELMRTTYNSAALAVKQMKDTNPEIRKIGARRLAWFLGTQAGTTMIPLMTTFLAGMAGASAKNDEQDALYQLLPDFYKNEPMNVIKGENGQFYVHFTNGIDGQSWFKSIMNAAVRGDGFDKVTGPIQQILSPFVNQNMVVAKCMEWYANKNQYDRPIYNPEDTDAAKAEAFMKHFGDLATPQTVNDVVKTVSSFHSGDETKGWEGVLKFSSGQTIMNVDPQKAISFRLKDFQFRVDEAKKIKDRADRTQQIRAILQERKNFLTKVAPLRK